MNVQDNYNVIQFSPSEQYFVSSRAQGRREMVVNSDQIKLGRIFVELSLKPSVATHILDIVCL